MTELGLLIVFGLIIFILIALTFLFGIFIGGSGATRIWKSAYERQIERTETWKSYYENEIKITNTWRDKSSYWEKKYKEIIPKITLVPNVAFNTTGPNNEIIEQKSNTVDFPKTMVLPTIEKPKNVKKKTISKSPSRTTRRKRVSD